MNVSITLVKDEYEFIYVIIFDVGGLAKPILILTKFEFEMLIKTFHTKVKEFENDQ